MDYEKERNLGVQSGEGIWGATPERDARALGNKIISTPETIVEDPNAERLGEILPAEPVLGTPNTLTPPAPAAEEVKDFDRHVVREEKGRDRISGYALAEIDKLERKLSQDGDLSSFYDAAREMTGAYLENSFDRKLGESK